MPKTITLRLDDATCHLFQSFAVADNRSISNLIATSAKKHLEECLFVDETEMRSIREDSDLLKKLKQGSRAARTKKGRFVE